MLAMFQMPNKFYEKDGRVTDPTGEIWDEVWGHTEIALIRRAWACRACARCETA